MFKYFNCPLEGHCFNFFLLLISLLFYQCSEKEPADNVQSPNIVLILTDDQGWGDLSSHGNEIVETPNLDRLKAEGVSFRNFFVSPVCAPTRASLLTGRYSLRTGTTWVTHRKEVMNSEEITLAELLKLNGYKTGIFGKWHNGLQYPNDPLGQGFDEFFGFSAGHWNNYFNTTLQYNQEKVATTGYIADVLTDRALQFIEKNRDNPFFCYIPYNTPHGPFQVPDLLFDKYKEKGLNDKDACVYAMCENIDDNVNRLLDKLERLNLDENTIIVFLTDNGPNGHRYNGGMKGIKGSVDEGGVKVPLFIRWKNKLWPGTEVNAVSAHIDILPTLAELCEITLPRALNPDGKSLVPLMDGSASNWPDRKIFNYKPGRKLNSAGAVRDDRYRLVIDQNDEVFLYNILEDPSQKNNVATEYPKVAKDLKRAFDQWFEDVTREYVEPPPIPVGFEAAPLVELPAPEASLHGNLKFKGKMGWANDWIIGWKSASDSVTWTLDVRKGGTFEVIAQINADDNMTNSTLIVSTPTNGSSHKITDSFFPDPLPSDDRVERGEVYEKEWRSVTVGKIDLKKGRQTIKLILNSSDWNGQFALKALLINSQINPPEVM